MGKNISDCGILSRLNSDAWSSRNLSSALSPFVQNSGVFPAVSQQGQLCVDPLPFKPRVIQVIHSLLHISSKINLMFATDDLLGYCRVHLHKHNLPMLFFCLSKGSISLSLTAQCEPFSTRALFGGLLSVLNDNDLVMGQFVFQLRSLSPWQYGTILKENGPLTFSSLKMEVKSSAIFKQAPQTRLQMPPTAPYTLCCI